MNTDEVAKSLLTSKQDLSNVIKFKIKDYTGLDKVTTLSRTSFENEELFVVAFQVSSEGSVTHLSSAVTGGMVFADWHIENQNIQRKTKSHYMWNDISIFENELLLATLSEVKYSNERLVVNPFEDNIREELIQTDGIITLKANEDIMKVFVSSEYLYFISKDDLYGTQ